MLHPLTLTSLGCSQVAPKQKHVRACILFTWDYKRSEPFWAFLRASPVLGDEIQTWKSLVLVHKVLRGGHPVVSFMERYIGWTGLGGSGFNGSWSRVWKVSVLLQRRVSNPLCPLF